MSSVYSGGDGFKNMDVLGIWALARYVYLMIMLMILTNHSTRGYTPPTSYPGARIVKRSNRLSFALRYNNNLRQLFYVSVYELGAFFLLNYV